MVVELVGRGELLQLPEAQHRHPVPHRHGLDLIVGDVDGGGAESTLQRGDLGAGLHAQLGVQVGQRLVHAEHLRLTDDRAAHRDALPLAAGEGLGLAGEVGLEVEQLRGLEDAAKVLDLTGHLDRKPANLSGGQRQRVAMGRAIVRDPKVFLMDEPLSNLDAKLRVQMRTEVSRIQQRVGTTMVYVTHDQTEAMTLGDRVAVMRNGVLQQVDTPKELYERPKNLFVAGFIGSPSMNFFPAEVRGGKVSLPFASDIPLPASLSGVPEGRVIAGLRPESFEDAALAPEHHEGASVTFRAPVDLVESMGSELYAYFTYQGETASSAELDEIAADAGLVDLGGEGEGRVVTRLSPESSARAGEELELWLDAERLHLFHPEDGTRFAEG